MIIAPGRAGNSEVTPEISSGEVVGRDGFRYCFRERVFFTLGVSSDNNHALARSGI
jgi:hypothetical protein